MASHLLPPASPAVKSSPKFDAAFIERRFRQHREWQERQQARLASEIVAEVVTRVDAFRSLQRQSRRRREVM